MGFCILPFTTDSRICFNDSDFLGTSPGVLWPVSPLQMWTLTHTLCERPWTSRPSSCPRGLTQTDSTRTPRGRIALPCSPCADTRQPWPQIAQSYRVTHPPIRKVKRAAGSPLLGRQWDKEPETEGEQNPSDQPSAPAAADTAMGHTQEEKNRVSQAEPKVMAAPKQPALLSTLPSRAAGLNISQVAGCI